MTPEVFGFPTQEENKKPQNPRQQFLKKTVKKREWFRPILIASVAAFVLVLVIGLIVLSTFLSAYEKAQPIHSVEDVLARYFTDGAFEAQTQAIGKYYRAADRESLQKALELSDFAVSEFETLEDVAVVLENEMKDKAVTYYASSVEEESAVFNVALVEPSALLFDEEESEEGAADARMIPSVLVASIHLLREKEEGSWGQRAWSFDRLEVFLKAKESVTVRIPADSKLTVNGVEVTEEHCAEKTPHRYNEYLPDGVEGITWCTYTVSGLFLSPEFSCTDQNGLACEFVPDEESGILTAAFHYDEDLREKYGERILTGMKEYAKYIQNDGSMNLVRPYFDTSSMFYRNIWENPSMFVWDHNGYYFANESTSEFYAYDENTFSCRITFDHCLKHYAKEDYVDQLDMIVFVRRIGNNFYIYDRILL